MSFVRLLPLILVACTGSTPSDDTAAVADTDVVTDTSPPEPEPVWSVFSVGTSSTLNGVYASGEGVYVAGTGAGAFVGGATGGWTALQTGLPDDDDFGDLWGQGAGATLELLMGATSGNVIRYSGGAWSSEDLGTSNHEGVGGSGPGSLFAVSWGGAYHFDGVSWAFETLPDDARLNDVWASGEDAFAVGEGGAIVRRTAGAWEAMDSGVDVDLNGISATAINDVWAVGADGVALHFDGTTWTATETGVTEALWAVFAPGTNAVYAVGNNGVALYYNGAEWTSLPTGVSNNLYAIHGASAVNVWAVGNRGTALQYKAE